MDVASRDLLVSRICSGTLRIRIDAKPFLLRRPSRDAVYIAQEIYAEHIRNAELIGAFDEPSLLAWMMDCGYWTDADDDFLKKLPKEIEEFKIALFKSTFKSNEKKTIRAALKAAQDHLNKVLEKRHHWDYTSSHGAASLAKSRYLIGCSLFWLDGNPVFNHHYEEFWNEPSELLEQAMLAWSKSKLSEKQYRELARTDPWRAIWATRGCEQSLFGVPSVDYTEEQRAMVGWSQLYDSVYEHQNRPSEDVIEDDDCLDGWMIVQKRTSRTQNTGEEFTTNERIRNSEEVFVVADTKEDARKVEELNDPHATAIKKRRFNYLAKKGEVNEADMPDTKEKIRMQHAQAFAALHKSKGE